jgi:hypothetical protein
MQETNFLHYFKLEDFSRMDPVDLSLHANLVESLLLYCTKEPTHLIHLAIFWHGGVGPGCSIQ